MDSNTRETYNLIQKERYFPYEQQSIKDDALLNQYHYSIWSLMSSSRPYLGLPVN
uniref:Uncharacterized protein n=1 Tax=Rhizophora mucronata TaxID=61149 RepID=A0A2P2PWF9_RHIMU